MFWEILQLVWQKEPRQRIVPLELVSADSGLGRAQADEQNITLFRYLVGKCRRPQKPKVLLVPAAGGDKFEESGVYVRYAQAAGAVVNPLFLTNPLMTTEIATQLLLSHDIVFFEGGDVFLLMRLLRKWNLEPVLREAMRQYVVLSGESAGALCYYEYALVPFSKEQIVNFAPHATTFGFLKGSYCPHVLKQPFILEGFGQAIAQGKVANGIGTAHGVGLCYEYNEEQQRMELVEMVGVGKKSVAYQVISDPPLIYPPKEDGYKPQAWYRATGLPLVRIRS